MNNGFEGTGIGVCVLMTMCGILFFVGYKGGYKTVQIDAINGKIHYELKENAYGSSHWGVKK